MKNKANKNEDSKADKKIDIKNEANKIEIQSAANKIEEQNEEIKKISKKKMGSREKNLSKKIWRKIEITPVQQMSSSDFHRSFKT